MPRSQAFPHNGNFKFCNNYNKLIGYRSRNLFAVVGVPKNKNKMTRQDNLKIF
jgi:hypothetical protein